MLPVPHRTRRLVVRGVAPTSLRIVAAALACVALIAAAAADAKGKKPDRGKPGTTTRELWCQDRYTTCSDESDDSCRRVHEGKPDAIHRCQLDGIAQCDRIWGKGSDCETRARKVGGVLAPPARGGTLAPRPGGTKPRRPTSPKIQSPKIRKGVSDVR